MVDMSNSSDEVIKQLLNGRGGFLWWYACFTLQFQQMYTWVTIGDHYVLVGSPSYSVPEILREDQRHK